MDSGDMNRTTPVNGCAQTAYPGSLRAFSQCLSLCISNREMNYVLQMQMRTQEKAVLAVQPFL